MLKPDASEAEIQAAIRQILILDTPSGTLISISTATHTAAITERPFPTAVSGHYHTWGSERFPFPGTKPLPRNLEFEDLGYQTIEGVLAHGGRFIRTGETPETQSKGTKPSVSELWVSDELAADVLQIRTDPSKGDEYRIALNNVQRVEPDPSLFQIPADYAVTKTASGPGRDRVK